jgi:hypothetical protein
MRLLSWGHSIILLYIYVIKIIVESRKVLKLSETLQGFFFGLEKAEITTRTHD